MGLGFDFACKAATRAGGGPRGGWEGEPGGGEIGGAHFPRFSVTLVCIPRKAAAGRKLHSVVCGDREPAGGSDGVLVGGEEDEFPGLGAFFGDEVGDVGVGVGEFG